MIPLVLVHGFLGGADQWHLQAPLFEEREVLALDLPGFGANAGTDPLDSIADYAAWVRDRAGSAGLTSYDLLGHSMGGMITQEAVAQDPTRVRRLVLCGTGAVGVLPGRFEPISTSMERARTDGAQATARRIAATWFLDGEAAEEYAVTAQIAERAQLPAIIAGLRAMQGWNGERALPHIEAPTLVLWGDRDRTYPWSQIAALWRSIPNTALAVLPDTAHAAHAECPGLFNQIVCRFLSAENAQGI